MLIQTLLTGGRDYEKSLHRRRWAAIGLLVIGLVGFVCYFFLVPDSSLSDYVQGFYLGAASGITAGALILLIRVQYLLAHPQARQKAKIKETDERELHITRSAAQIAGGLTVFGTALSLFVVLPLNMAAFQALFGVTMFYALCFALSSVWLSKRM